MKRALIYAWMSGLLACSSPPAADPNVIMEADRVFATDTANRGVDGWVEAFAEDGKLFGGGQIIEGPGPIRAAMAALDDPDYSLTWEPVSAEVSGDLGYTHGTYRREVLDPEGNPMVETGRYVTIWRQDPGGGWKVVVDIGSPAPPARENPTQ